MATRVATGFALILAMAFGLVMLAEVYTLQDTGEAATSGNLTTLFTLVSPIAIIVVVGAVSIACLMAGIMLLVRSRG